MIRITLGRLFKSRYKQRIYPNKELVKLYKAHTQLFKEDRTDPVLADHQLTGRLEGKRAFSITDDIRVVYISRSQNHVIFLNIGTHAQVYGM